MLSRDQVLHVARLARLELTDEEVGQFVDELSKVLDHIETIGELGDMEDVPGLVDVRTTEYGSGRKI